MAERTILGVDFSGAEKSNGTSVTNGVLRDTVLELKSCDHLSPKRDVALNELEQQLCDLPKNSVVAIDFPFSVPRAFAERLVPGASRMTEVWNSVVTPEYSRYSQFDDLRNRFVARHGEVMRRGDANFGGPFSPLHAVNPSMLQMTYYGMRMLHRLRKAGFRVPPLPDDGCDGPILLETMPGVLLRTFGLPAENYKNPNKTNKGNPKMVRREILDGLEDKSGVTLKNLDDIRKKCLDNHDRLDSLVASVGGALWAMDKSKDKSQFITPRESIPPSEELEAARLEGWIYAPRKT